MLLLLLQLLLPLFFSVSNAIDLKDKSDFLKKLQELDTNMPNNCRYI